MHLFIFSSHLVSPPFIKIVSFLLPPIYHYPSHSYKPTITSKTTIHPSITPFTLVTTSWPWAVEQFYWDDAASYCRDPNYSFQLEHRAWQEQSWHVARQNDNVPQLQRLVHDESRALHFPVPLAKRQYNHQSCHQNDSIACDKQHDSNMPWWQVKFTCLKLLFFKRIQTLGILLKRLHLH